MKMRMHFSWKQTAIREQYASENRAHATQIAANSLAQIYLTQVTGLGYDSVRAARLFGVAYDNAQPHWARLETDEFPQLRDEARPDYRLFKRRKNQSLSSVPARARMEGSD